MKQYAILLFLPLIGFTISCSKGGSNSNPQPTKIPPVVVVTPPVVDNTPVYQISLARTNQTILNDTHSNIIQVGFEIAGNNAMNYSTSGNVSMRVKNFAQSNVTYDDVGGYNEDLYMANAVQVSEKATIAVKDTATKACWIVTDPAAKDASGKQIVQILFMYNDLTQGSGSAGFQSKTKFSSKELTADQAMALFTLNDLKPQ